MSILHRLALSGLLICSGFIVAAAPPALIQSDRVTILLEQLDEDEFDIRQRADEELRRMGKAVVPYLHDEHLRTGSLEVRGRLGRMIRDLTIDERIPDLVKMLSHTDARFRNHATFVLKQVGPDQLPALEAELQRGLPSQDKRMIEQLITELSARR